MAFAVEEVVEDEFQKLLNEYPGTMLYYGLSFAAISEIDPSTVEGQIASIAGMHIGCYVFIEGEYCDHVASTLIGLVTVQGLVCAYDSVNQCRNVC